MTVIPIVIRELGTVIKWLVKGLEEVEIRTRVETIQTTELIRSARILRRVLEIWGDFIIIISRHFSLSFIASGRSFGLHPVSSHSCCMYVRAGRPAFARTYVGVHRSRSLMSSSLHLQQCPACLVRLAWIVFVMGDRWPYSWCLVGCCLQDLFSIARNILV